MAKKKTSSMQGFTAVIYARYSSHAQNDASIEQQVERCRAYAEKIGVTISEVYSDKAMSGTNDKRPSFQKMMRDAQRGAFQIVIAWKSNRMGRNMLEAMINDAKLSEHGIRCMYCEEDFGDTAAGRFALRNMMNVNQFYSENMAEDIKRGMLDNAQQCKVNGLVPLGFKRGSDGRYEIDESSAEIVREIFKRIIAGETYVEIADDLNARSIKTSSGRAWGKNSFHGMIENERYIGVYSYGDIRIEGGIPRILDDETFYGVREKMKMKQAVKGRKHFDTDYILTGKLFCGMCGSPMVGVSGTSKTGAIHNYYYCRKRKVEGACAKDNVRKEYIEHKVAEALKMHVLQDSVIEWVADSVMQFQEKLAEQSQLAYYKDKLVDVQRSIDNIMKAIESGMFSETFKKRMDDLEKKKHDLHARIALEKAQMPTVTRDQVIYYMETFRDGDVSDPAFQKALFDGFLSAVYLYDDRMRIVFNYAEGQNEIDFPCSNVDMGSSNDSYAPPLAAETNPVTITMIGTRFVFTIFF